jgi:hypothetical protein
MTNEGGGIYNPSHWADCPCGCNNDDFTVCQRCGGTMKPSKAIAQTYGGSPDFAGGPVVTMSPEGPGKLIDCLKCERCGHSITPNAKIRGCGDES